MNPNQESVKKFILEYPQAQLFSLLYEGKIGDDEEVNYISGMILHFLRNTKDIIPKITEHYGVDLAARCFISTSFFKEHLEHLTKFHGNPSYKFYLELEQKEFILVGKTKLADHVKDWAGYIQERLKKPRLPLGESNIEAIKAYEKIRFHKAYDVESVAGHRGPISKGYSIEDFRNRQ